MASLQITVWKQKLQKDSSQPYLLLLILLMGTHFTRDGTLHANLLGKKYIYLKFNISVEVLVLETSALTNEFLDLHPYGKWWTGVTDKKNTSGPAIFR